MCLAGFHRRFWKGGNTWKKGMVQCELPTAGPTSSQRQAWSEPFWQVESPTGDFLLHWLEELEVKVQGESPEREGPRGGPAFRVKLHLPLCSPWCVGSKQPARITSWARFAPDGETGFLPN